MHSNKLMILIGIYLSGGLCTSLWQITKAFNQDLRPIYYIPLIFYDLSNIIEEIIFKDKIGRIRDIIIHPENGKIFFLNPDGLYLMEKN